MTRWSKDDTNLVIFNDGDKNSSGTAVFKTPVIFLNINDRTVLESEFEISGRIMDLVVINSNVSLILIRPEIQKRVDFDEVFKIENNKIEKLFQWKSLYLQKIIQEG